MDKLIVLEGLLVVAWQSSDVLKQHMLTTSCASLPALRWQLATINCQLISVGLGWEGGGGQYVISLLYLVIGFS